MFTKCPEYKVLSALRFFSEGRGVFPMKLLKLKLH